MKRILAIILGLVLAFLIMTGCEFLNSLLFPFPAGMDLNNLEEVRAFTQTLPWTAYILVLLGWSLGAFFGGFLLYRVDRTARGLSPIILGIILTLGGVSNFIMLEHPIWVMILGLLIFIPMSVAGFRTSKLQ